MLLVRHHVKEGSAGLTVGPLVSHDRPTIGDTPEAALGVPLAVTPLGE